MEAAGALRRGSISTYLESIGALVRTRSRVFWIVASLTVLAGVLRFATLGVQSYHHDEIVTASRILRDGFWHAMDAVGFSESAPPLYYAIAWAWTQLTGTGEFGLRTVSAVAGVATVPVAYLLGAELSSRRTGVVAAALVAVNPMLLWYSQEARAYALFVLLTALSLLYFVRALERGRRRDSIAWGIASALALATHYFAFFPIAAEALWLLRRRGRASGGAFPGIWIAAAAGLLLTPLLVHQSSFAHAEWISNFSLWHRLWETGLTFALGETGDIIAQPEHPLLAVVPALIAVGGIWLVFARGGRSERRAATIPLALAAVTVVVPLVIGLLDSSKDYVLARNLLPALVPLLVALAVGFTLRGARRSGAVLAGLLVAYSLGFSIWASVSPALQRPDWDSVATAIGEPTVPRAMVTWKLGEASLRYYLSTGSIQVQPSDGFRLSGPGFREVGYQQVGRLYVRRFATPGSELRPLRLRTIRDAQLGFRTNGVLLDGVGPG
jgi:mannosyltransferase